MAITLNNGFTMPIMGLGVWTLQDKKSIRDIILTALKIGYRHFDCAAHYKNEAEVGEPLAEAFQTELAKREELFITTKLWNSDHGHAIEACKDSPKKLQLEYLDLYLVHFPVATRHIGVGNTFSSKDEDGVLDIDTTITLETTCHAMEDLVSIGLVRTLESVLCESCLHFPHSTVNADVFACGNYNIFLTIDCLAYSKVKPAVNQLETHPYFQRDSLVKILSKAWNLCYSPYPSGGGARNVEVFGSTTCLDDPILKLR